MPHSPQQQSFDDEIYFGKLTIEEIKKRLMGSIKQSKRPLNLKHNPDTSLKIIETHSQPNLRSFNREDRSLVLSAPGSPALGQETSDESFLKMESMVSDICSSQTPDQVELNNTLEVIDYILKQGAKQKETDFPLCKEEQVEGEFVEEIFEHKPILHSPLSLISNKEQVDSEIAVKLETEDNENKPSTYLSLKENPSNSAQSVSEITLGKSPLKEHFPSTTRLDKEQNTKPETNTTKHTDVENHRPKITPLKQQKPITEQLKVDSAHQYLTPVKGNIRSNVFLTPSSSIKSKTPIFKTPASLSSKTPAGYLKKTPNKIAFQHIKSPVASYINNCPQVPLVKDVHPKKPLPGPSAIPKLVKKQSVLQNKENVELPTVAYKSAKKTEVINVPDQNKLPQCQWARKLISAMPPATVMKHEKREMNLHKKAIFSQNDESFTNLSCFQADVSVCTQKTAFKSQKH